jgi:transaldolase
MEIFVDSADIDEIRKAREYGMCDGVTTNPSLIKKAVSKLKAEGKLTDMESYVKAICEAAGKGKPVSLEVVSLDAEGMVKEGETLFAKFNPVAGNVVIKIPVSTSRDEKDAHYEGLKAIKALSKKKIPVNATLIMSPEQALLAGKAGAKFVSPFAGRIDDFIRTKLGENFGKADYFPAEGKHKDGKPAGDNGISSGVELVRKTKEILDKYGFQTKIIAASLRNARQVREVALAGTDIATIPFDVLEDMIKHPKTFEGIVKFSEDTVPEYLEIFSTEKKTGKPAADGAGQESDKI